jgi:hypothetical protein
LDQRCTQSGSIELPMKRLTKLWRSLDLIVGQLAIPARWQIESSEDFEFLSSHLRPTDTVGALYSCPHRYGFCPRKIVDYGDGEFAAICRDPHQSCERVPLAALDALLYELDLAAFLRPILRAISIRQEAPKGCGHGTWSLGLSTRRSSLNQPAFLIIAHETNTFESAVNELLVDVSGQFLILAPTNQHRCVQVQERLQARRIGYVCLNDQVGVDQNGCFVSVDPLDSANAIPTTPVANRKGAIADFRARHSCKVVDIQRSAGVDKSDYYKWLNGSIPDHYSTCIDIERVLQSGPLQRGTAGFP